MRILVTGATGRIGSALVPELVRAGHNVTALARSSAAVAAVEAMGATALPGAVDDLDTLRAAAAASDAAVNLAFRTDLAAQGRFAEAVATDVAAIEALGDGLPTGAALAVASGTVGLARGGVPATEHDRPVPESLLAARAPADDAALAHANRGLRPLVIRLAPTNHGPGDQQFLPALIALARHAQFVGYPGDGSTRWPATHILDTARLIRRALEVAPEQPVLHAVAEEGIPLGEIAQVIGRHLRLPVHAVPADQLDEHYGPLAMFLRPDSPVSSALTREATGWTPREPGLLDDLKAGHYFT